MEKAKRQQMPKWLTMTLLGGLALVLVTMPFHAFISTWGGTTVGPLWLWKSWKELLLAGLLILAVAWVFAKPAVAKDLFRRGFVWVLLAYVAVSLLVTLLHFGETNSQAVVAGLGMNFRYLLAGVVAYIALAYGNIDKHWLVMAGKYLVGVGVLVSLLGIVQSLLLPADFLAQFGYEKDVTIAPYVMVDDNPELLRAYATLSGPNDFGAWLILPIMLTVAWWRRSPLLYGTAAFFMVWALVLSSSRSAWLGLIASLGLYALIVFGRRLSKKQIALSLSALVVVGLTTLYLAVTVPVLRMAIFHSSPGDTSLHEGSTMGHIEATLGGVERVVDNPLGCGVGCAGPASFYGDSPYISENYFVQIAEEVGLLGLALFLLFVGMVAYKIYADKTGLGRMLVVALAGYAVIGMLLHVWSDDPLSITWWILAGAVLGYNARATWKKSKASSLSQTS